MEGLGIGGMSSVGQVKRREGGILDGRGNGGWESPQAQGVEA